MEINLVHYFYLWHLQEQLLRVNWWADLGAATSAPEATGWLLIVSLAAEPFELSLEPDASLAESFKWSLELIRCLSDKSFEPIVSLLADSDVLFANICVRFCLTLSFSSQALFPLTILVKIQSDQNLRKELQYYSKDPNILTSALPFSSLIVRSYLGQVRKWKGGKD